MKFQGKALLILIIIGSLNSVLSAQTAPNTSVDRSLDKATITEQNMNTASSPYRNLTAEEVIDTMYPDPLAEGFMGKRDTALDIDRNRSVADMLQEFEGQAKVINDATVVPENIKDNHTKEDRERIEARAEKLLKEKALNESADNKGEKRVKENLLGEEEVLYDESLASDSAEIASESIDIASASILIESQKNINDAQIKDWPEANEDPEFSNEKALQNSEDDTEIILVDDGSKPLPDEIPDYTNMSGITNENVTEPEAGEIKVKEAGSEEPKKLSKRDRLRKKMATPLEPVLLTQGKPKNDDDESLKTYSYSGLLIPEKQPVTRRKKMIRWTLQLDDGTRIPIKSNLKLLQEVRKEDNLDDYVTITGKMRRSALEEELKYFIPETIVKGKKGLQGEITDDKKSDKAKDKNAAKKEFTGKIKNSGMFKQKNASDTAEQPELVSDESSIATDSSEIAENTATDTVLLTEDKAEAVENN